MQRSAYSDIFGHTALTCKNILIGRLYILNILRKFAAEYKRDLEDKITNVQQNKRSYTETFWETND